MPKKKPKPKDVALTIRMTQEEALALHARAEADGVSAATVVRRALNLYSVREADIGELRERMKRIEATLRRDA